MPEIQIRPAAAADIPHLVAMDHSYTSDNVWQMDLQVEEGHLGVNFRLIRLPRSVRVDYPRSPRRLAQEWEKQSAVLVALLEEEVIGYACVNHVEGTPNTAWITDLVVMRRFRRHGIGTTLVLSCQEWGRQKHAYRLVLEMQPKNFPAYSLAEKLGFDFCGYNDRYYDNNDIALFFAKSLK